MLEPEIGNPLKIQLELQPKLLDHLITADLIKSVSRSKIGTPKSDSTPNDKPGNGNGNGNGGGNEGGNGSAKHSQSTDEQPFTNFVQENPFLSLPEHDQPIASSVSDILTAHPEKPANSPASLDFFSICR